MRVAPSTPSLPPLPPPPALPLAATPLTQDTQRTPHGPPSPGHRYTYYLLRSVGVKPAWKKLVTNVQIFQFMLRRAPDTPRTRSAHGPPTDPQRTPPLTDSCPHGHAAPQRGGVRPVPGAPPPEGVPGLPLVGLQRDVQRVAALPLHGLLPENLPGQVRGVVFLLCSRCVVVSTPEAAVCCGGAEREGPPLFRPRFAGRRRGRGPGRGARRRDDRRPNGSSQGGGRGWDGARSQSRFFWDVSYLRCRSSPGQEAPGVGVGEEGRRRCEEGRRLLCLLGGQTGAGGVTKNCRRRRRRRKRRQRRRVLCAAATVQPTIAREAVLQRQE